MDLNSIWFGLVGVLLTGYVLLDGFDLGVGAWLLLNRKDQDRQALLKAIGPVWDGNEVWLITGGGALFAAFPHAYATAFSAFYLALFLLLAALIGRAAALEFRNQEPWGWWRELWDTVFAAGSLGAAGLLGVAAGNVLLGLPIGPNMEFTGNFFTLLRPFPLLMGGFTVSLFALHGALYLLLKTEGELNRRLYGWVFPLYGGFVLLYVAVMAAVFTAVGSMRAMSAQRPWLWAVVALNFMAALNLGRAMKRDRPGEAFLSCAAFIITLMALFALGLFPNLLLSNLDAAYSLTITNAASSAKTLGILLVVAGLGMPLVIAYTVWIYWVFRGKVRVEQAEY